MLRLTKAAVLAVVAVLSLSAVAYAASWTANPGTSYSNGVVTLDSNGGPTSYENSDLGVAVNNGDTITFQWRTNDGDCGGGVPRVFIQGGAFNTHDGFQTQCAELADADGWRTWTATVSGITDGTAGYTGIVNDNTSNPTVLEIRNLVIAGTTVFPSSSDGCKKGGFATAGFKNQGECVASFKAAK